MRILPVLLLSGMILPACAPGALPAGPGGEGSDETCRDGVDNDADGRLDCADPDCHGYARCGRSGDGGLFDGAPWGSDLGGGRSDGGGPAWPVCRRQTGKAVASGGGGVDIIWFVDTSGSMTEETAWVQQNLNAFATYMGGLKADYRVVMVAEKRNTSKKGKTRGICVPPPLGGAGCGDGPRYRHVAVKVGSTDGLQKLISTYPQWSGFVRKGATKNFVAVTDDESKVPASWFEGELAKRPAGGFKGFVFHSIAAFGPDPKRGCATGARYGRVYEALSKKTGGSMFQVCLKDWKPIFSKLARRIAATARPPCTYKLPAPPLGRKLDLAKVRVTYLHADGRKTVLPRVAGATACGTGSGYYFNRPATPDAILFCPQSCKVMQGGSVQIDYGCVATLK